MHIEYQLLSHDPHKITITKTWLHKNVPNDCVVPRSYNIFRKDRDSSGGEVCIVVKGSLNALLIDCEVP